MPNKASEVKIEAPEQESSPTNPRAEDKQEKQNPESEDNGEVFSANPKPCTKKAGTGISIKEKLKKKQCSETIEEEEQSIRFREGFSSEQMIQVWNQAIQSIEKESPNLFHTLKEHPPVLEENFVICLTLDNKLQKEEAFRLIKPVLRQLKDELKNDLIQIKSIIDENQEQKRPYTNGEKFRAMSEKNPSLIDLKDKLGLEIGY